MFIIRAPYPAPQLTTVMPSPRFSDSVALRSTLKTARAMDGTLYTYIKKRDKKKKLKWDFKLSADKAKELRELFDQYHATQVQITDHNEDVFVGYFKSDPFEFQGDSRAGGWPGNELVTISIEFEEAS